LLSERLQQVVDVPNAELASPLPHVRELTNNPAVGEETALRVEQSQKAFQERSTGQ
jgi:hypothetical protein